MSELKTLRDLGKEYASSTSRGVILNRVDVDELKTEAIKWGKRLKDKKFYDNKENLYWFIEHFFNITEEDL